MLLAGSHSGVWALYFGAFGVFENVTRAIVQIPQSNPVTDARLFLNFCEIAEFLVIMRVRWVETFVVVVIGSYNLS